MSELHALPGLSALFQRIHSSLSYYEHDFSVYREEIRILCRAMQERFLSQPCLVEISGGVHICGDVHGQFQDLLLMFRTGGEPGPDNQYLFLGDYVDRGKQSLETILYLYYLKLQFPHYVHFLRGNHESASVTKIYGFQQECRDRIATGGMQVWKTITDSFNRLPVAALVDGKIFCVHGGLSPELYDFNQINNILRPTDIQETGLMCDLLWSDPSPHINGWDANDRGVSYTFGRDVVDQFCRDLDVDLVVRAHQVVEDGYEFFANKKLLTIFSAPNYGGDFSNDAAMLHVSRDLVCTVKRMKSSCRAQGSAKVKRSYTAEVEGLKGTKTVSQHNDKASLAKKN